MWPVRPLPMPDELLSSWLNRLAVANGMAPRSLYLLLAKAVGWKSTLTQAVFTTGNRRAQIKETSWIDLRCSGHAAEYVSRRSGMPIRLIQSLALRRPKDVPAGTLTPPGTLQWELVEAIPHLVQPDVDSYGYMRFCPYCLGEWDDPWFRKSWRTWLAEVCTRHGCRLLRNCACGKSVRPHLSNKRRSQAFCYSCDRDLRRLDSRPAYPREIRSQKERYRCAFEEVEKLIRNGNDHSLIATAVSRSTSDDVMYIGFKHIPCLPLLKTGLIDAHGKNSAMSLYLIYRKIRHCDASPGGTKQSNGQAGSS